MQLIRRPKGVPAVLRDGCVATIGTFDGVHIGHRQVLARVFAAARERSLPSLVFSFEPAPREFFSHDMPPARLTRFREKFTALAALGTDCFFCPPFDRRMEGLEPMEFVSDLLVGTLRLQHLIIGDDFRFARKRRGTLGHLRDGGQRFGFTVEQLDSVTDGGQRVSSTLIREALAAGEMARARDLLGRWYRMAGRVVSGKNLGKELGFPTANVKLNRRASPVAGIFAVRVDGLGAELLDGVASVGTRPTIGGGEPLLEVHIFDFERNIYGRHIEVEFIAKLREEVHFPDLDSLTAQMRVDAAEARAILRTLPAEQAYSSPD